MNFRNTIIFLFLFVLGCSDRQNPRTNPGQESQVDFALSNIQRAIESKALNLDIRFALDDISLSSESFKIEKNNNSIIITGGDSTGLMYGGLELAEQIALNGEIKETISGPYLKKRGIKFNIPLDARTPSYDDTGDAAQKNIIEMWSWDFWEQFLDKMALYRYNTLTLWNPHPFPSMIKMNDYPDVALDDVCVTTLQLFGMENEWGEPGLVSKNVLENLKIVKKISIDEKIAFWQKIMLRAKHRGIDVYFINWNICPNSVASPVGPYYKTAGINFEEKEQPGKHGITHELDNPVTIDYFRKATRQFLLTYPDLKGFGVTAGEHMPKRWDTINREEWLWNTYGKGILDAKAEQPGRKIDFIHRVWDSDMDQIMKFWSEYPDNFEVSFKYAKARLYSSPNIPFAEKHIQRMEKYGLKSWWNLRNDDIFVYRWGDPEYVRKFINQMPGEQHTAAFHMGSDGYVWGREFISKNEKLSGQLEIEKHWFNFMLWGRLSYDNQLDDAFFIQKLQQHFPSADANELFLSWQMASKIIPLVNTFHWRDWDHHWSIESSFARPVLGGYRDVTDFINNPTMQGSDMLNPLQYAKAINGSLAISQKTPLDVSKTLDSLAQIALGHAAMLRQEGNTPELETLLDDILAMAHLGLYYSGKIRAAVALAMYSETGIQQEKQKAIELCERNISNWKNYKNVSEKNYKPQMLARVYWLDWTQVLKYVVEDVSLARNYSTN